MIGYVTLGTNDLVRAAAFYDAFFPHLGAKRIFGGDRSIYWGKRPGLGLLALTLPHDGEPATVGNGVMVALAARDRATVDGAHAAALSLGAVDEGAPGPRGDAFYGAYFRDPDGNKLCVFTYEKAD